MLNNELNNSICWPDLESSFLWRWLDGWIYVGDGRALKWKQRVSVVGSFHLLVHWMKDWRGCWWFIEQRTFDLAKKNTNKISQTNFIWAAKEEGVGCENHICYPKTSTHTRDDVMSCHQWVTMIVVHCRGASGWRGGIKIWTNKLLLAVISQLVCVPLDLLDHRLLSLYSSPPCTTMTILECSQVYHRAGDTQLPEHNARILLLYSSTYHHPLYGIIRPPPTHSLFALRPTMRII